MSISFVNFKTKGSGINYDFWPAPHKINLKNENEGFLVLTPKYGGPNCPGLNNYLSC